MTKIMRIVAFALVASTGYAAVPANPAPADGLQAAPGALPIPSCPPGSPTPCVPCDIYSCPQ
jgi:hypothetical protein